MWTCHNFILAAQQMILWQHFLAGFSHQLANLVSLSVILRCISVSFLYYIKDQVLPRLIRGQVHRCVGNYDRQKNVFTCMSVRAASLSEQRNAQEAVKASDAEMRNEVQVLSEMWSEPTEQESFQVSKVCLSYFRWSSVRRQAITVQSNGYKSVWPFNKRPFLSHLFPHAFVFFSWYQFNILILRASDEVKKKSRFSSLMKHFITKRKTYNSKSC